MINKSDNTFKGVPRGKYRVILADPPWTFKTRSDKGLGKSAQAHYDCMSQEEILAMPVYELAARDSALFMWATWPTLPQAFRVIDAWGFTYKGLAWEWIKFNPETGKYAFGTGYGTRKNVEPCLLATKGAPKRMSASVRDIIMSPRREHSRKPPEQYDNIQALFRGPYLELFARHRQPGWDAWGNQVFTWSPSTTE